MGEKLRETALFKRAHLADEIGAFAIKATVREVDEVLEAMNLERAEEFATPLVRKLMLLGVQICNEQGEYYLTFRDKKNHVHLAATEGPGVLHLQLDPYEAVNLKWLFDLHWRSRARFQAMDIARHGARWHDINVNNGDWFGQLSNQLDAALTKQKELVGEACFPTPNGRGHFLHGRGHFLQEDEKRS